MTAFRAHRSTGIVFALLGVLLCAVPAQAAFTRIGCVAATDSDGDGDAITAPMDTTGATLIVIFTASAAGSPPAPTDSQGLSWTAHTAYSGQVRAYDTNPTSTSATHTFTMGGAAGPAIAVCVYSGSTGVSLFDQESGDADGELGTTIDPDASITPSQNNEVVITAVMYTVSDTPTISAGLTIRANANVTAFSNGVSIADDIQTTATARQPTWTVTNFQAGLGTAIASFKLTGVSASRPCCLGVF